MKHIIAWELRRRRWFLAGWSIGLVSLVALTVLIYDSVTSVRHEAGAAIEDISGNIGSFIGTTDLFSPIGYLNSQLYFITLPILFIIASIVLANNLLGKEEGSKTLELLLARPISRNQILGAKALAGLIILTILGGITALATIICVAFVESMTIGAGPLLLATFGCVYFSGAFGAIAFGLFAASLKTRRFATLISICFAFGSYVIVSLGGMLDWLGNIAQVLPYHYYDPNTLLNSEVPTGFLLYTIGIYVASAVIGFVGFRRRDIS